MKSVKHILILVTLILISGVVLWQIDVSRKIQQQFQSNMELSLLTIKKQIEENATCYNLYKEITLDTASGLYLLIEKPSGSVDTLNDYLAVLGNNTRNFNDQRIDFETRTKVDISMRVEYLMSQNSKPSGFQQWIDSSNSSSIIDSSSGISLGDSNQLKQIICSELQDCNWAIFNSNENRLTGSGNIETAGIRDTVYLFKNRISTFANPFKLVVAYSEPSWLTILITRWESWVGISFVVLLAFLLFLIQHNIQQQQMHLQKEKSMLNHISHEFNTQITKISMAVESFEHANDGEERKSYERILKKASVQLSLNLSSLLQANQPEAKKAPLVAVSLQSIINELKDQINLNGKTLEIEMPQDCTVNSYNGSLKSAIENVITNAVKYGGNIIKVAVISSQNNVEITIWDNGTGVPEDSLDKLTQEWFRVHNQTQEGFGIGLSYVAKVVKELKGALKISNTQTPKGFEVKISLRKA